ncbi:MAG: hypothetical protein KTR28_09510 [Micavibrio sp.]|nr:hypothetical protein [Micavibrio sp.]
MQVELAKASDIYNNAIEAEGKANREAEIEAGLAGAALGVGAGEKILDVIGTGGAALDVLPDINRAVKKKQDQIFIQKELN